MIARARGAAQLRRGGAKLDKGAHSVYLMCLIWSRVRGLTKYYGDFRAIHDVSFTAERGRDPGSARPNGAGKTTTMRIVTGYMPASEGSVSVEGFDVATHAQEARRRIGYLPENPPLYHDMTVNSYLKFVARIKGVAGGELRGAVERVIERCFLSDVASRILSRLSKGYRQRVGLAQALIHNPPVIVLDEPTIGLDPRQIIEIRGLIKELAPIARSFSRRTFCRRSRRSAARSSSSTRAPSSSKKA
jgi:ABC-2 type transport system ATP-binding protein